MTEIEEPLTKYSVLAISSSSAPLGVDATTLAKRLQDGEIARLLRLLNAALPHVEVPGLRRRIEDLLSSVTDGRMPMFEAPESELDWALGSLRRRRTEGPAVTNEVEEGEPPSGPADPQ
jgi:hypothetical protein